jgi:dTDP-glucose 4,6-dehydratase
MGTFVLVQVARKLDIQRFVHVSTDEVYGDIQAGAFADETSPLQPSSPYSASKASSDLIVKSYVRTFNFPAVITRASNNYGPFQFPEKFLPLMITNALDDQPLPIYGDGKQQRDWLHVEDHCSGILAVLERGRIGEVYNIGGLDVIDNLAMARRLLRAVDKPETLLSYVKDRPGHDRRYALSCDKIGRELGWKPAISLEEGLRQTIDWYRTNTQWLAGVRGGEYRSYYEKYYQNRDSSLHAIAESGRKSGN